MINLSKMTTDSTSDAKVNVNVKNNVIVGESAKPAKTTVEKDASHMPELNPYDEVHYEELSRLQSENNFLKRYLQVIDAGEFVYKSGKRVLSSVDLLYLVKFLANAVEVSAEVEEEDPGCLCKSDLTKINAIYIDKGSGDSGNMKYCFSDVYRKLGEYNISTKYCMQ